MRRSRATREPVPADDAPASAGRPRPGGVPVDIADSQAIEDLCTRHGIDRAALREAIDLVGPMPLALDHDLASRGSRREAVTAEMRAPRETSRACGPHGKKSATRVR